jgi:hypothetical protein
VDSLILSWVKYEKQLRRLFCFLVFQQPQLDKKEIDEFVQVLADNNKLYPETFIYAIEALGAISIQTLLDRDYPRLWEGITRIQKYRNKLMHGQMTGQSIQSPQIEADVILVIEWISRVADAAYKAYGYDGLTRNTKRAAKTVNKINLAQFPFSTAQEFESWLLLTAKQFQRKQSAEAAGSLHSKPIK